jgi:hypothetical protein
MTVPGAISHEVTVRHGFVGGLKVLVDGVRAERGSKRSKLLISAADGTALELTVQAGRFGTDPVIVANTNTARIGRRVQGGEWVWVGVPLLLPAYALFVAGGPIDFVAGLLAVLANIRIFIDDGLTVGNRYLYSLAAMGLIGVVYLAYTVALVLLFF